ncbi:MAG: protein-export chaperone SecB, partial [Ignavibacteria bacterium]|nr:protein-export chaperone SecB [Ignavibacteria bacterium]
LTLDLQGFQIITNMKLHIENVFELDLTGVGNFAFTDETPEELKKELINKNATAIMFPYLRSFVSTFSASCGMILGHLVIPIQFFQGDLKEIREPSSKEIVSEVEKKAVK